MNSPMTVGQPVDFVFEPEKVETYNTEHGTAFKTLDAAKVVVTPTEIQAGSQYGELSFELDLSELDYDDADKYMVPLTLKSSELVDGTIVTGPSTFYIEVNKTLKGTYDKEVWGEEKSNRVLKPAIFIAGQDGYAESRNAKKQKYIINYNQTWTGGLIYFNIRTKRSQDIPIGGYSSISRIVPTKELTVMTRLSIPAVIWTLTRGIFISTSGLWTVRTARRADSVSKWYCPTVQTFDGLAGPMAGGTQGIPRPSATAALLAGGCSGL